jgi:hypothetical protein
MKRRYCGTDGTDKAFDSREKFPIREIRGKIFAKMDASFVLHCKSSCVLALSAGQPAPSPFNSVAVREYAGQAAPPTVHFFSFFSG